MAIAPITLYLLHHTSTNLQMSSIIWPYNLILSRHSHQQQNYISQHRQLWVIIIYWTLLVAWTHLLVNLHLLPRSILLHHIPLLFRLSQSHQTNFSLFNTLPRAQFNDAGILCKSMYHLLWVSIFPPVITVCFIAFFLQNTPLIRAKVMMLAGDGRTWYRYSRDSISNDIVFGTRILIRPNVTLDASTFIQWADTVDLYSDESDVLDPFDFEFISPSNRTRNLVPLHIWMTLSKMCSSRGILPPTIGKPLRFRPNPNLSGDIGHKRKR